MSDASSRPLVEALAALRATLEEVGAPYMIIGGTAVILRGVSRVTEDVDATVWAENLDVTRVLETFSHHGVDARIPDAGAFAQTHHVLLLKHRTSGTPLDVSMAFLPFERDALARAEILDVEGIALPVARPRDLVVYKAVAWRDRDRADIERLLRTHGDEIDLAEVRRIVAEFADVLGEPERVAELDALIARTRRPPDGRR